MVRITCQAELCGVSACGLSTLRGAVLRLYRGGLYAHWGTCYPSPALALIVALSLALAFALAFALGIALACIALALVVAIALAVFALALTLAAFALLFALFAFCGFAIIARLTYVFALRLVTGLATWGRLRVNRRLRGLLLVKHV